MLKRDKRKIHIANSKRAAEAEIVKRIVVTSSLSVSSSSPTS